MNNLENEMRDKIKDWLESDHPEDLLGFVEERLLVKLENELFNSKELGYFNEVFKNTELKKEVDSILEDTIYDIKELLEKTSVCIFRELKRTRIELEGNK